MDPEIVLVANIINEARIDHGIDCLKIDSHLNQAAQNHADYMDQNEIFSHFELEDNPGFTGEHPFTRMKYSGYLGTPTQEFVGLTKNPSPEELAQLWIEHDDPEDFPIPSEWTEFGIGFSGDYWAINFGRQ